MSWRRHRSPYTVMNGLGRVKDEDKIAFSPYLVWRAKKTGVPIEHKTVTIKCMGKFHKIEMRFPGAVSLLNHDRKEERLMAKLSIDGETPACLEFLKNWREEWTTVADNRPIVKVYAQARVALKDLRSQWKAQAGEDRLEQPLHKRLKEWVEIIHGHLLDVVKGITPKKLQENRNIYWDAARRQYTEPPRHGEFIMPRVKLSFEELKWNGEVEVESDQD